MKSLLLATALHFVGLPALPASLEQQLGIDYIGRTPNAVVAMAFAALDAAKPAAVATDDVLAAFVDPTATWHLQPLELSAVKVTAPKRRWHRHPQPTEAYAMEPVPMPQPRPVDADMYPSQMDPRSGNQGRTFGLPGKDSDYRRYQ